MRSVHSILVEKSNKTLVEKLNEDWSNFCKEHNEFSYVIKETEGPTRVRVVNNMTNEIRCFVVNNYDGLHVSYNGCDESIDRDVFNTILEDMRA